MKSAIVYKSVGGNTKLLADIIARQLHIKAQSLITSVDVEDVELVYVGFWTDKGECDEDVKRFLKGLHHQKIFLFGTAGFGGDNSYFQGILTRVQTYIDDTNEIVGTYMCQGKMPDSVKQRYLKMSLEKPHDEHIQQMIANFEEAVTHPDLQDLENLRSAILETVK